MQKELIKWINAISFYPIGNIIVNLSNKYDVYYSVVEQSKKICDRLSIEFLLIKTKDIPSNYIDALPSNLIGFKTLAEGQKTVEEESIKYFTNKKEISKYDYIIVVNEEEKPKLKIDYFFQYLIIHAHKFILFFLIAFTVLDIFFNPIENYHILLILHGSAFYLLFDLSSLVKVKSSFTNKVCNFSSSKEETIDSCTKLKNNSNKMLGILEFADVGAFYFLLFILSNLFLLLSGEIKIVGLTYLVMLVSGVVISVYSVLQQIRLMTFCNICLITVVILIVQVFLGNEYIHYELTLNSVLLILLNGAAAFIFLSGYYIISYLKESEILLSQNYDKLFSRNKSSIVSNLKFSPLPIPQIKNLVFSTNNSNNNTNELIIITDLQCGACKKVYEEIKKYKITNTYNIKLIMHILQKAWSIQNNPLFDLNVKLSIIYEEYGMNAYLEVVEYWEKSMRNSQSTESYIKKHYNLSNEKYQFNKPKIIQQNSLLEKYNVIDFPMIIFDEKIIPSYISLEKFKQLIYE